MDVLNLGGPGWIKDVFSIEISVDSDRVMKCHSLLFQDTCPLVSSNEVLKGTVKVTAPPNCEVWQNKITMAIESTVSFFETLATISTDVGEFTLKEAGYIKDTTELPFEIDLSQNLDEILETYDGEMFSVRHSIKVLVSRPWWTFDVTSALLVGIHKINPAPPVDEHFIDDDILLLEALPAAPPPAPPQNTEEGADPAAIQPEQDGPPAPGAPAEQPVATTHRLRVVDTSEPLEAIYERSCMNIGDSFRAKVYIGHDTPEHVKTISGQANEASPNKGPLKSLQLVLYKIEAGDGESNEVVVRVKDINLAGEVVTEPPAGTAYAAAEAQAAQDAAAQGPADAAPIEASPEGETAEAPAPAPSGPLSFDIELPLTAEKDSIDITPTVLDSNLSVRWYVRLAAIHTSGATSWNTHEVVLHRANVATETI